MKGNNPQQVELDAFLAMVGDVLGARLASPIVSELTRLRASVDALTLQLAASEQEEVETSFIPPVDMGGRPIR